MPKSYTVEDDYNDSRLDKWFKNKIINLPHSLLEKIIRKNKIKVNKKKTKSSYRLQKGDLIEIYDISKLKPTDKKEQIKYLPKKKEISNYISIPKTASNSSAESLNLSISVAIFLSKIKGI